MLLRSLVGNYARQAVTPVLRDMLGKKIENDRALMEARATESISVAVVFATAAESGGFCDLLKEVLTVKSPGFVERSGHLKDQTVLVVETGIGPKSSEKALRSVLSTHDIPLVIVAGFAASLDEKLSTGDIVIAEKVFDQHGESIDFHASVDRETVEKKSNWHLGELISVDKEIRSKQSRTELAAETSAIASDMETFAIAKVCREMKVPCVGIRVIADGLQDEDQQIIDSISEQNSLAGRLGATAGALWRKPKIATQMFGLKQTAIERSDELATFIRGLIRQLH